MIWENETSFKYGLELRLLWNILAAADFCAEKEWPAMIGTTQDVGYSHGESCMRVSHPQGA